MNSTYKKSSLRLSWPNTPSINIHIMGYGWPRRGPRDGLNKEYGILFNLYPCVCLRSYYQNTYVAGHYDNEILFDSMFEALQVQNMIKLIMAKNGHRLGNRIVVSFMTWPTVST